MITERKQLTPDGLFSCAGLALLVLFAGAALWIFILWQIMPWLWEGVWHSYPITTFFAPDTGWIGLKMILDWIFALPITLLLAITGIIIFWLFGLLSAKLYQYANSRTGQTVTPAQTHA